jgi:hypothetical protein
MTSSVQYNRPQKSDITRGSLADRLNGKQVEVLVAKLLPAGELVTDRQLQFADLDVIDESGTTYSVKYQKAAYRTGNFSFEVELGRAGTDERTPGNFEQCKADQYVLVYPLSDSTLQILFIDRTMLEELVDSKDWPVRGLNQRNIDINNSQGRYWNDAFSKLVPVARVKGIARKALTHTLKVLS